MVHVTMKSKTVSERSMLVILIYWTIELMPISKRTWQSTSFLFGLFKPFQEWLSRLSNLPTCLFVDETTAWFLASPFEKGFLSENIAIIKREQNLGDLSNEFRMRETDETFEAAKKTFLGPGIFIDQLLVSKLMKEAIPCGIKQRVLGSPCRYSRWRHIEPRL